MDRAKYIKYFNNYKINKLKKLPRLSIKKINNWFSNLYYRRQIYGYYGHYKMLDSFGPTMLLDNYIIINTAISFNKLKLLKYLEKKIYWFYKSI